MHFHGMVCFATQEQGLHYGLKYKVPFLSQKPSQSQRRSQVLKLNPPLPPLVCKRKARYWLQKCTWAKSPPRLSHVSVLDEVAPVLHAAVPCALEPFARLVEARPPQESSAFWVW